MRNLESGNIDYDLKNKLTNNYFVSKCLLLTGLIELLIGIALFIVSTGLGVFLILASIICFLFGFYKSKIADSIFDENVQKQKELEERINKNKVDITLQLFTFEEAIKVMIGTNKTYCKSVYDYNNFFECAYTCILKNITEHQITFNDKYNSRQKLSDFPVEKYKGLTSKTVINSLKNFIAIDTETTGLKSASDDIIELSAIKFEDFIPKEIFHTYLKPRKSIPKETININRITDEMVINAPEFSQIINDLQDFIKGFHLVAYNAQFDMKFLHSSGLDLSNHKSKIYDVYAFAKKFEDRYDIDNYKLSSVCAIHNIGDNKFHNATSDALACGLLFIDYVKEVKGVKNTFALINPNEKADYDEAIYLKSYKGEKI